MLKKIMIILCLISTNLFAFTRSDLQQLSKPQLINIILRMQRHHNRPGDIISPLSYFCTNSNDLITSQGISIYKFRYSYQCQDALKSLGQSNYFCSANKNELVDSMGSIIFDFRYSYQCKDALESLVQTNYFCTGDKHQLVDAMGNILYDFKYSSECQDALTSFTQQ